jgi:hypothetical protein
MSVPGKDPLRPSADQVATDESDLLTRHVLGELDSKSHLRAEELLAKSASARAEFTENVEVLNVLAPKATDARLPETINWHKPIQKESPRNTLLTWRRLFPAAGLAGLMMGAGVWWALDSPAPSPKPLPEFSKSLTPETSTPALALTPKKEADPLLLAVEVRPPPTFSLEVGPREINLAPTPVGDPLLTVIEPAAPTPLEPVSPVPTKSSPNLSPLQDSGEDPSLSAPPTPNDPGARQGRGSMARDTENVPQVERSSGKTLARNAELKSPLPSSSAPPRNSPNLSPAGEGEFRAVPGRIQPVKKPTQVGFYVPKLAPPLETTPPKSSEQEPSLVAAEKNEEEKESSIIKGDGVTAVDYSVPLATHPFTLVTERVTSPWNPERQLLMVGLKALDPTQLQRAPANLAFLVDISASMKEPVRLPLIKEAMLQALEQLTPEDRVAFVVYAGNVLKLLPSTSCQERAKIVSAILALEPVSTIVQGAALPMAYDVVRTHFKKEAINRVVIITDGDFTFGVTREDGLFAYIENQAKNGIGLSVIGVGAPFIKDLAWKSMARLGRGTYARVSTVPGAVQALLLQTQRLASVSAKDVRVELSFNENQVKGYRLIGYENKWPRYSLPAKNGENLILALYEIEKNENETDKKPLNLKVTYQPDPGEGTQSLSAQLPQLPNPQISAALQQALQRAEKEHRALGKSEAALAESTQVSEDSLTTLLQPVENANEGPLSTAAMRALQEKVNAWIPSKTTSPAPSAAPSSTP